MNGANPSPDVEESRVGRQGGIPDGREDLASGGIRTPSVKSPKVAAGDPLIELLVGDTAMT